MTDNGDFVPCLVCGERPARHEESRRGPVAGWFNPVGSPFARIWRCCRCHVRAGEDPSDWHPECLAAAAELEEENRR